MKTNLTNMKSNSAHEVVQLKTENSEDSLIICMFYFLKCN